MVSSNVYGLLAEFDTAQQVVAAAGRSYTAGYRRMDAFTPFPVEGLVEALGHPNTRIPIVVFAAGALGAIFGFLFQYWANAVNYPINVGGRPLNSWIAFIPVTFELTILFAALTALLAMLLFNGLPRPHHPLFNVPDFERATQNSFFLCLEADDPQFDLARTRLFLEGLGPRQITEVRHELE